MTLPRLPQTRLNITPILLWIVAFFTVQLIANSDTAISSPSDLNQSEKGLRITGKIIDPEGILSRASQISLFVKSPADTDHRLTPVLSLHKSDSQDGFLFLVAVAGALQTDGILRAIDPSGLPFSIPGLPAGKVTLLLHIRGTQVPRTLFAPVARGVRVVSFEQTINLTADHEDVIIRAAPPADAPVLNVTIKSRSGIPLPLGELNVEYRSEEPKAAGCMLLGDFSTAQFPIENGRSKIRLPGPGWIKIRQAYVAPEQRIADKLLHRFIRVPDESDKQEITLELQ